MARTNGSAPGRAYEACAKRVPRFKVCKFTISHLRDTFLHLSPSTINLSRTPTAIMDTNSSASCIGACSSAMDTSGGKNTDNHPDHTQQDDIRLLPAELRNEILRLAIVEDAPIEVTQCWPGITGTSKQLREETLAIYFGNNKFQARIVDLEDTAFIAWLEKMKGIAAHHKYLITSLEVVTEGRMIHMEPRSGHQTGACFPNFEFWDNIIAHIACAGFTAGQVTWPSSLLAGLQANTWPGRRPFPMPLQLTLEDTLLHGDILPPLLKRHGLHDDQSPPINVLCELSQTYGPRLPAWIAEQRARSTLYRRRYALRPLEPAEKPWWETPVDSDSGWEERNRQYRQQMKQHAADARLAEQLRQDEQMLVAANALMKVRYGI